MHQLLPGWSFRLTPPYRLILLVHPWYWDMVLVESEGSNQFTHVNIPLPKLSSLRLRRINKCALPLPLMSVGIKSIKCPAIVLSSNSANKIKQHFTNIYFLWFIFTLIQLMSSYQKNCLLPNIVVKTICIYQWWANCGSWATSGPFSNIWWPLIKIRILQYFYVEQ